MRDDDWPGVFVLWSFGVDPTYHNVLTFRLFTRCILKMVIVLPSSSIKLETIIGCILINNISNSIHKLNVVWSNVFFLLETKRGNEPYHQLSFTVLNQKLEIKMIFINAYRYCAIRLLS